MIIICGSRREGNSYYLANYLKKELEKQRLYVDIITPGNQKIHLCTGCMDCDLNGVCDFTDDMQTNIEKIRKDDTIMFITPTRWNLLSGDIKIFMDRLNPLFRNKELKDKKMIAVSIASSKKELYQSEAAISSLTSFAESAGMQVVLTHTFNNCLKQNDLENNETDLNTFLNKVINILN